MNDIAPSFYDRSVQLLTRENRVRPWVQLPDEAVEQSVSGGLCCGPCRRRLADHPQPLDEADQYSRGACRLNTVRQLTCRLRPRKCSCHPGLHGFEKAADATIDFRIAASQFHGCCHQQAATPTLGIAGTFNVTRKEGPQTVDRRATRV